MEVCLHGSLTLYYQRRSPGNFPDLGLVKVFSKITGLVSVSKDVLCYHECLLSKTR